MSLFPKRHVLRAMTLKELSAVDKGAQEGSRIVLRKSHAAPSETRVRLLKQHVDMPDKTFWGIAVTSTINGQPYFDLQGDHVPVDVLRKAAHQFMLDSRQAGAMHITDPETGKALAAGRVVESCVMSEELAKSLGINLPGGRECWIVGVRVENPHVLKMVEAGHLAELSIGGSGMRVGVEKMSNEREIAKSRAAAEAAGVEELVQLGKLGMLTDEVVEKARDDGLIGDHISNEEIIEKLNEPVDGERLATVFKRAFVSRPRKLEKFDSYLKRVFGGASLSALEHDMVRQVFKGVKHEQRKQNDIDVMVRKAAATLDDAARAEQAAHPGMSFQKAWSKVAADPANADLYKALRQLGHFAVPVADMQRRTGDGRVKGPGHDEDGSAGDVTNHADGDPDEDYSADEDGDALGNATDLYTPDDVSEDAASGNHTYTNDDGGIGSNKDHSNLGMAEGIKQMRSTADQLRVQSAAAGKPMSDATAVTKAYSIHSDLYKKLRKAGWDGKC
ncbi:MAG: XkdF-like putative serine protease domain-containing protein [Stellaceae bacterium]